MPFFPTLTAEDSAFGLDGDALTVVLTKIKAASFVDAIANDADLPTGKVWDQSAGAWADGGGTKLPLSRLRLPDGFSMWLGVYDPPGVAADEVVLPVFYHSRLGNLGPLDPGVAPRPRAAGVTLRL